MSVKLALIASCEGKGHRAIIEAYKALGRKRIWEVVCLISTVKGVECIKMAKDRNVKTRTINRKSYDSLDSFNFAMKKYLINQGINLVFLVGCIHKIHPIDGITIYNIHPARIPDHGGKGMYGLAVHESVLLEIVNDIKIDRMNIETDRFFTQLTIHEVVEEYDSGIPILTGNVEIPRDLIFRFLDREIPLNEAAKELQKIVLPIEHMMLPTAVNMAAERIINKEDY